MREPVLRSVAIENFRSIRGAIQVPLDAPVVLIHAANGTGKTSVLSAIELALTGQIGALARVDPHYDNHLLNYSAWAGSIELKVDGLSELSRNIRVDVGREGFKLARRVNADLAKFFSERCYLAQSLLGQLLAMYQQAGSSAASPLSRFVHELLGLERLDALEQGLTFATDLRLARNAVPAYSIVEEKKKKAENLLSAVRARNENILREVARDMSRLKDHCNALGAQMPDDRAGRTALRDRILGNAARQEEEDRAAANKREVQMIVAGLDQVQTQDVQRMEGDVARGAAALEVWRAQFEEKISAAVRHASALLGDDGSELRDNNPDRNVSSLRARLDEELSRVSRIISEADETAAQLESLQRDIHRGQAAIVDLGQKIRAHSENAESLSFLLENAMTHVHDDVCPVCDRDFAEISELPLATYVRDRARDLSRAADQVGRLSAEMRTASVNVASARELSDLLMSRAVTSDVRRQLADRRTEAAEYAAVLRALAEPASNGTKLYDDAARLRRLFVSAQKRSAELSAIRDVVEGKFVEANLEPPGPDVSLRSALSQLAAHFERVEAQARRLNKSCLAVVDLVNAIEAALTFVENGRIEQERVAARLKRIDRKLKSANGVRADMRKLRDALAETRHGVVKQVFNENLNRIWRDLFVRLAPSESFVPAFFVPASIDDAEYPRLETIDRAGRKAGTPGAMLSAGNLNTAALTLFLALHLSVAPKLPWLLLDDPVQSMDDIHVMQFAALLRTLAKEHKRQVIIAVHDRQLFDYLALELAPAFEGDELLCVDLARNGVTTTADVKRIVYEEDTSIRPAAA